MHSQKQPKQIGPTGAVLNPALLDLFAALPVADFGLIELREWMIQRGWSRKLINPRMGRVRRTVKWAVRYTADEIKSPMNIILTICKNFLVDYLDRFVEQKRNEHKFKNEWEHEIMAEKSRKQHTLLLYIDDMPGCEIREVFNKHLNLKQNIVVWLV